MRYGWFIGYFLAAPTGLCIAMETMPQVARVAAFVGSALGATSSDSGIGILRPIATPAQGTLSVQPTIRACDSQSGSKQLGVKMGPIFSTIEKNDQEIEQAHRQCAETIFDFVRLVEDERESSIYMAKLRFRDPDRSQQEGQDSFFYLWLSEVRYHPQEKLLSGVFFEVPEGFEKWHPVGSRLGFDPEDVFDWMVIDNGHAQGGFTVRLTRARLGSDSERAEYDNYIGIQSYEPIRANGTQKN
ncbi:MAG: DUF2314 domain-containing protein [Pseudomonas sp.]|uniref:DUF2314 domain-containing protein n=1 Tax=Pseudomonas sp. TaxID=306 RepID=UPI003396331D